MQLSNYFGDRDFFKTVLRLGLPMAIQQLLTTSLSMVDSLMIGALGEYELAAVGMAGQFVNLYWGFCFAIVAGGMLFFAQYWGSQDIKGIQKASSIMFSASIVLSILFSLASVCAPVTVMRVYTDDPIINAIGARYLRIYGIGIVFTALSAGASSLLRATENVRLPLFASVMSLVTNTLLNWILIYGNLGMPALGVEGAAIASVTANFINFFIMLLISIRDNNLLMSVLKTVHRIDLKFVPEFFRKATPIIINECGYAIAVLLINMVLGRQGADNLSALAIFRTIEGFVFIFFQGLATAASVIVGKYIGAGQMKEAIRDAKRLTILTPILTLTACLTVYLLRRPITNLYSIGPEVQSVVFSMLLLYMFTAPLRLTNYHLVGVFRAGGDSKTGMFLEVGGIWLLGVPLISLAGLVFHWPFVAVFAMLYAEDVVKISIEILHFLKNKWIKPVTPEGREGLRKFLSE